MARTAIAFFPGGVSGASVVGPPGKRWHYTRRHVAALPSYRPRQGVPCRLCPCRAVRRSALAATDGSPARIPGFRQSGVADASLSRLCPAHDPRDRRDRPARAGWRHGAARQVRAVRWLAECFAPRVSVNELQRYGFSVSRDWNFLAGDTGCWSIGSAAPSWRPAAMCGPIST